MRLRPPARYARRAPDAGRDGGGVRQRLRASRQAVSWSIHRGDDSTREGDRARLEGHLLQRFLVRGERGVEGGRGLEQVGKPFHGLSIGVTTQPVKVIVRGLKVISSRDFLYGDSPIFSICALPSLNRWTLAKGSGTRWTSELAGLAGCRKLVNSTPGRTSSETMATARTSPLPVVINPSFTKSVNL